ncbi:uncharacterized protein LOC116024646 [Ipomoea triloba]|uniref:uncharacterized protein LOC116024646 n=1 Tax=Ipomoea triloba TaxID=35885 RepID=UPI00125E0687|nr:uncharacterized protein LOC116024646 [Ipomoea triloba]
MTKTKGRSSPTPRKSKFSSLEFTAEDERVDKDSRITLCKFKKRKSPQEHSPINKYTSLKSLVGLWMRESSSPILLLHPVLLAVSLQSTIAPNIMVQSFHLLQLQPVQQDFQAL